mmetsp:Transcript_1762/g.10850  ORF Transcript_1762/g.10850 Transcript_1762/m.10850 type:complete len:243 (+) Transcript_1762:1529-2257(+)
MTGLPLCARIVRLHSPRGTRRVEERNGSPTSDTEVEGADGWSATDRALDGGGWTVGRWDYSQSPVSLSMHPNFSSSGLGMCLLAPLVPLVFPSGRNTYVTEFSPSILATPCIISTRVSSASTLGRSQSPVSLSGHPGSGTGSGFDAWTRPILRLLLRTAVRAIPRRTAGVVVTATCPKHVIDAHFTLGRVPVFVLLVLRGWDESRRPRCSRHTCCPIPNGFRGHTPRQTQPWNTRPKRPFDT